MYTQTYFRRLCQLTEKARRTYQHIVAALENEAQKDEAVQAGSHKTDDLLSQLTQSTSLELSSSDNKLADSDAIWSAICNRFFQISGDDTNI